jgi:hypothetical protein
MSRVFQLLMACRIGWTINLYGTNHEQICGEGQLCNGSFREIDPELQKFPMNSRRAPSRLLDSLQRDTQQFFAAEPLKRADRIPMLSFGPCQ